MGKDTYRTELGKRLRALRKEKKLTTRQVADEIGIKQNTYSTYETKHNPKRDVLIQLAAFYGVTVDYLLGNEPVQPVSEYFDGNEGVGERLSVGYYDDYRPFENEDLGKVSEQEILLINSFRAVGIEAQEYILKYLKNETEKK